MHGEYIEYSDPRINYEQSMNLCIIILLEVGKINNVYMTP